MTTPNPTPAPPTLGGLFSRAVLRAAIVVALVVAAIGIYAYRFNRAHGTGDQYRTGAAWCRDRYLQAHDATDTSRVDNEQPAGESGPNAMRRCRELRLAGRTSG